MHVLSEPGLRVVARPDALDAAVWHDGRPAEEDFEPLVLRFAPDDAFAVGAVRVDVNDPDAIVDLETGFTALMVREDEFAHVVAHIEWSIPEERPVFLQGAIAGVPARLYIDPTGAATILVPTAYVDELTRRLR